MNVLSVSGASESAACRPSPVAEHPSALPSPTSSPFSSPEAFLQEIEEIGQIKLLPKF